MATGNIRNVYVQVKNIINPTKILQAFKKKNKERFLFFSWQNQGGV